MLSCSDRSNEGGSSVDVMMHHKLQRASAAYRTEYERMCPIVYVLGRRKVPVGGWRASGKRNSGRTVIRT